MALRSNTASSTCGPTDSRVSYGPDRYSKNIYGWQLGQQGRWFGTALDVQTGGKMPDSGAQYQGGNGGQPRSAGWQSPGSDFMVR